MPWRFNNDTIREIVNDISLVMEQKVRTALEDMRFIMLPEGINVLALRGGNPAIYINRTQENALIVERVNDELGGSAPLRAAQSATILLPYDALTQFSRPVLYGILLHEIAHAWAERCGFDNTEHNAWLFEIQWVCDLAKHDSDRGREMLAGIDDYFRRCAQRYDEDATRHLRWTLTRTGLEEHVNLSPDARIETLVAASVLPRGAKRTPPGYPCTTCEAETGSLLFYIAPRCGKHGFLSEYRES